MLNEVKIHYFLTLAESGSFSGAAKELHITQQALSKQIGLLEAELECALFDRSARGVSLTDAGIIMQKTFQTMGSNLEQAKTEIKNNARSSGRVLNIGCGAGLRPGPFMNSLCQDFAQAHSAQLWFGQPDTYHDLITWLTEDKFDLVLCTDDYQSPNQELRHLPLCRTPLYFFVSRSHPMASSGAALRDFAALPFYLTSHTGRTDRILSICARDRFLPAQTYQVANPYSAYLMVEAGSAVSFGTGFSLLHTNPGVRAYRIPDEAVHLECLWRPEGAGALTRAFVHYLEKRCDPDAWYYPDRLL
jgi:DNA-binding transcriptional LysR family regulator